jgi:hypothetical protein
MAKWMLILTLGVLAAGIVGCHAEGHADDSGVGAHVGPND